MANPAMNAAEKKEVEQSFWYEAGTLVSQGLLYLERGAEFAADPETYAAADALFESILTKLRSLDSFFQNMGRFPTDADADDLVPGYSQTILTSSERRQINVRVAHLTYLRPPAHAWDIGEMVRRGLEACAAFMKAAGVAGRDNWSTRLAEIEQTLKAWTYDDVRTENDSHAFRP